MKPGRPPRYSARHRFIIEVLFLHGLSASRISRIMLGYGVPMTRDQVRAQVSAMGYRRRTMTAAERQFYLDRLRESPLTALPEAFYEARDP